MQVNSPYVGHCRQLQAGTADLTSAGQVQKAEGQRGERGGKGLFRGQGVGGGQAAILIERHSRPGGTGGEGGTAAKLPKTVREFHENL